MELESDSWGVFGWCRCQSKLQTRSVAKNSRERVGKRKLWCAQKWDLPMGAFGAGGVYPVVDGATTGLCMSVQSYGSTSCALDSAVKAQYEGPGRLFRLPGRYFASGELDNWASDASEWIHPCFGSGSGFGFMVVLTHMSNAPAAKPTLHYRKQTGTSYLISIYLQTLSTYVYMQFDICRYDWNLLLGIVTCIQSKLWPNTQQCRIDGAEA